MKIVCKPIKMICWFDEDGTPNPIRFKLQKEDESFTIIKIDNILFRDKEQLAGNPMLLFRCKSYINGFERIYELKYELVSCKWILWKI